MSDIHVRELCVSYGQTCALHDVDLSLPAGRITAIVGPNGGGKSTLLKTIADMTPIQFGTVQVDGNVAYLPQTVATGDGYLPLSVEELVLLGRVQSKFWRKPSKLDVEKAEAAMKELGIWDIRKRRIAELSGGQRQRVHLARALTQQAEILLLDEPTTGVDPQRRTDLYQFLKHLNQDHQLSIVLVTHEAELVRSIADEVVVIDRTVRFQGDHDAYQQWLREQASIQATTNPFGVHLP